MSKRSSLHVCLRVLTLAIGLPIAAQAATISVPPGGDLQAAIDAAQPGDTILLAAGATYVGNFRLRVHGGTSYVTIRSAASDVLLPPAGARMTPAYSSYLPKLRSATSIATVRTDPGAAFWRLQFLELEANYKGQGDIVSLGDGSAAQNTLARVPHHLIVDRVYIHGDVVHGQKRGIGLNSGQTSIVNSHISEIKGIGQDVQAIAGWNGPGPYRIENNYLEAATEVLIFGGDDPKIPNLTPSDIVVRNNVLRRPASWRDPVVATPAGVTAVASPGGALAAGTYAYRVVARRPVGTTTAKSDASVETAVSVAAGGSVILSWAPVAGAAEYLVYGRTPGTTSRYWTVTGTSFVDDGTSLGTSGTPSKATVWQVKNIFELKNAQRVQVDHNLMENNWSAAQNGFAVLFTPRNQYGGCTWCVVRDVVFEYNVVRHVAGGINLLGEDYLQPTQRTTNIVIRHNEFSDVSKAWGGSGYFMTISDQPEHVTVDHNTIVSPNGGGVITAAGGPISNFVFTNNVTRHNSYGVFGANVGYGNAAIAAYFPGGVFTRNVFAGGNASKYPAGNEFPTLAAFEAHFADYVASDFALHPGTDWANAGTDGLDLGVAYEAMRVAQDGADVNPPQILTTALPGTTEFQAYAATVEVAGGSAPYQWSVAAGALPAGITLDPVTGTLIGAAVLEGDFVFTLQAEDASGTSTRQPLLVHVDRFIPANVAPTVTLSVPATASIGSTAVLEALPADADGSILRVDFYRDGVAIGTAASAPYRLSWAVTAAGPHSFTAVAIDDRDGFGTSEVSTLATTGEIVLYASDVAAMAGNYALVADATAAGGWRLDNPDLGAAKVTAAAEAPATYAELTFFAEAGRRYQLWIRGRAERNSWRNDSVFIQFDGVAGARIGTTTSLSLTLEDDVNLGVAGWGWQDHGGGAGVLGAPIVFEQTGPQTIRIQPREDGFSFDQIAISPERYLTVSPGALKNDTTILAR
jgi:Putative Ig domain/Bacterial Ig domain